MALAPDDDRPPRPRNHEIGQDLGPLSIEELAARVDLLRAEIARIEAAVAAKTSQRQAADQLFGKR